MRIARPAVTSLALVTALAAVPAAQAQDLREFSTRGLPGSEGVLVRVSHPSHWKSVDLADDMALAELRGTEGRLTGILQIGRGRPRQDMQALCRPERARTMLQGLTEQEPDTRVTDVVARQHQGRSAYELRYERSDAPGFLVVRTLIVCLKDSRLVVSCGGAGDTRTAVAGIEPVCRQVLDSLAIAED